MSSILDGAQLLAFIMKDHAPKKRESSWTCRLPVELLSIVLEYLTEDKALGTLAVIQSTSRATYTIATPYLYRNIILDIDQAVYLLGQFDGFPRSENRLICQPIPPSIHLLDLHLSQRLRACFSNTRGFSLELREGPNRDWFATRRLNRYKELVTGLLAFEESSLWPSLKRCNLNMQPKTRRAQASQWTSEIIPCVDAVFTCMHPQHLSVVYFDESDFRDETYQETWTPCIKKLQADHIELFDMIYGDGLPFASLSMTIHFSLWAQHGPSKSVPNALDSNFQTLDRDTDNLDEITHLKLVMFGGKVDRLAAGRPHDMTQIMDSALPDLEIMVERSFGNGRTKPLKITIQSDTSAEGKAGAVSRVFKP